MKTRNRATVKLYHPLALLPPHRLTHPDKADALAFDMHERGWRGAVLIGYLNADGDIQLLSGTHRRMAAAYAQILVPVRVYSNNFVSRCFGRLRRWQCLLQGKL